MKQTCETCRFYNLEVRQCQAHPPVWFPVADSIREGWPGAHPTDWCGEHQPKDGADPLVEACRQVYANIDNHHDVDTTVGDGSVHYRESPYSGAGEDLQALREALASAGVKV